MRAQWREALAGSLVGLLATGAGIGARGRLVPAAAAPTAIAPAAVPASSGTAEPPCSTVWQPAPSAPQSPPPWQAADAQALVEAHAQMVALLNSLPTYPGARQVGPAPYGVEKINSEGMAAPDGAPLASGGLPMSPDLVDVFRVWRASGDALAAVDWLAKWAQQRGWTEWGSGQGGGPTPADDTAWKSFRMATSPTMDGVPHIQVVASGNGLVRYDAFVIVIPPRPAGETVPAGAAAAVVTVCNGVPERQIAQVTITEPTTVTELADAVNGLHRDTAGIMHCANDTGFRIFIDFRYASAPSVEIMDYPACDIASFRGTMSWPGLSDLGLRQAVEETTGWDLNKLAAGG